MGWRFWNASATAFRILFCRRYRDEVSVGTLIALMLPYSAVFIGAWTLRLIVWNQAGWPLGL